MSLVFVKCKLLLNFNGLEENIEIIYSVCTCCVVQCYVHGLGDPFQVTTEKHLFQKYLLETYNKIFLETNLDTFLKSSASIYQEEYSYTCSYRDVIEREAYAAWKKFKKTLFHGMITHKQLVKLSIPMPLVAAALYTIWRPNRTMLTKPNWLNNGAD